MLAHARSPRLRGSLAALALATAAAAQNSTERISVSSSGVPGNNTSSDAYASHDGRYVVFQSFATNLVTPDVGGYADVFVRDRIAGTTERVNIGLGGVQADSHTRSGPISADGRFVSFWGSADNLVASDSNQQSDVFLRDRLAGVNERVSVDSAGSQANGSSSYSALTPDARFVAFQSTATNLVGANDLNGPHDDVFLRDRATGTTVLISANPAGSTGALGDAQLPALSDDGRFVVFMSADDSLVANDTNQQLDVLVRDVLLGTTEVASRAGGAGGQSNAWSAYAAISADGRWVAFQSAASNLVAGDSNGMVDIFVRDRATGSTTRVNLGPGGVEAAPDLQYGFGSYVPQMSSDGTRVAYFSAASNLVPGDVNGALDAFVRDIVHATTVRVDVDPLGAEGKGGGDVRLSGDGSLVVFGALANTFLPGVPSSYSDVFARRVGASLPSVFCTAKPNSLGCVPAISFENFASVSQPMPFIVSARHLISHRNGLFFYGFAPLAGPFQGGTLCVQPPTVRTQLLNSGGNTSATDCSGYYAIDLNQRIQTGHAFGLTLGTRAYGQFWMRDPQSAFPTGLSDALDFTVLP